MTSSGVDFESIQDGVEVLNASHLIYLAEGGANVIFKIGSHQGMLLRVRKHGGAASASSYDMLEGYEQRIKPLFPPKYLLQQRLIRLPRGIATLLQRILVAAEEEGIRPTSRRGEHLELQGDEETTNSLNRPNEQYGILIQDLSPKSPTEYLLEFKPKWLVLGGERQQAGNRCRTCALRQMRKSDGTPPGRGDSNFCPLDLLSGKSYILMPALRKLWTVGTSQNEALLGEFEKEFRRKAQPLLGRLKALQALHSHVEVQDFDQGTDDDISLAMALRDCSVFVKVDTEGSSMQIVDVKLADLDLKATTRDKREKWMKMQRRLVEEGWYEDRMAPGPTNDEVICWVSRTCT